MTDPTTVPLYAWVDELPAPDLYTKRSFRADFVEILRTRPGQWAQYRPGHPHRSSDTARRFGVNFPNVEGAWRKREDGHFDIYARSLTGEEV